MTRRQLLLRGALLAAMAPVVRAAGVGEALAHGAGVTATAADVDVDADANARLAGSATSLFAVHDPAYRRSREFAAALRDRGARTLALEPDAMTAWHHTLREAVAGAASARIVGLTTRTDYLVLRDLARTAGLAPLATRDADARIAHAGVARRRATLIAWVLGARIQSDRVQGARVQAPRAGAA